MDAETPNSHLSRARRPALVPEALPPPLSRDRGAAPLPWVTVAPGSPYFVTEDGAPWTPIGQNDAISWVEMAGLFRRRDLPAVEQHLRWLKAHDVTCLRVMAEYAQVRHRYLERPVGRFVPAMVQLWDDLFVLCERVGLRLLVTPFDTFWHWLHWTWHPYNVRNGGILDHPSRFLLCGDTRRAIKARLTFMVERWGGSGAFFAWDLWNEIHPEQAAGSAEPFGEFIHDLSQHVKGLERRLYGRAHPQTVSIFGPELRWRADMGMDEPIFRHPDLDFASIHIYMEGTIDDPKNTVDAAISTGEIVRNAVREAGPTRPFLDSEHGPIHRFKDKKKSLPEPFDDEYFRFMQWAHLASGAAGGGMRWPNRHPHVLTHGMRRAQHAMAKFLPLIDWSRFPRVNLNEETKAMTTGIAPFACSDGRQAVIWLLRRDSIGSNGMLRTDAPPVATTLRVPGMQPGRYRVTFWDTATGAERGGLDAVAQNGRMFVDVPEIRTDVALAVTPVER